MNIHTNIGSLVLSKLIEQGKKRKKENLKLRQPTDSLTNQSLKYSVKWEERKTHVTCFPWKLPRFT